MRKQILLIEDDELFADLYSRKLVMEGFSVEVAKNGLVGLEITKHAHPDLVLLDLVMPQMGGLEFLEAYKNDTGRPSVRVVVVTNHDSLSDVRRSLELGVLDYLLKSKYTTEQMVSRIRSHITNGQDGAQPSHG